MGVVGLAMAQRKTTLALLSLAGLMGSWSIFDTLDGQTLQGTWTMKSPLPAVRAEVAAVALDGKATNGLTVHSKRAALKSYWIF